MVSDAFSRVCPIHNRTQPDASKMQPFQQTKRVDILKSIQMGSSLQTHPDALTICDAFRCFQNATFSRITTLFDTKTLSDASYYCMRKNAFENPQKLFKNITLYFANDPFLSLHDIPISIETSCQFIQWTAADEIRSWYLLYRQLHSWNRIGRSVGCRSGSVQGLKDRPVCAGLSSVFSSFSESNSSLFYR